MCLLNPRLQKIAPKNHLPRNSFSPLNLFAMKKITLFIFCFCLYASIASANFLRDLFEQAMEAFGAGQYDQAIELFQKSLQIKPDLAPAYNYMGLAYKAKGSDFPTIMNFFKKAIEADPQYAPAYENLGKSYYSIGEIDKAIDYCRKAVKLQPDLVTANLSLGWIYLLAKSQPRTAIKYFRKVGNGAQLPFASLGLGIAYFQDNQYPMMLETITS